MSSKRKVPALAAQTYWAEGEFPCALYEADSGCAGMTDKKNFCYGCKAYVCSQCDQVDVRGAHELSAHQRRTPVAR